jgi:hypothetical protein
VDRPCQKRQPDRPVREKKTFPSGILPRSPQRTKDGGADRLVATGALFGAIRPLMKV